MVKRRAAVHKVSAMANSAKTFCAPIHLRLMRQRSPTIVRSYSKINLGLRIGPPRPDGFHDLTTLFQTMALHDLVTVQAERAAQTGITLTCSDARVPCDARNTVWRMVSEALAGLGVTANVHLHLQKNLPMQGGMGAGSANAAAALLGLERELGIALAPTDRQVLAARVGSDVPVFLVGGTVYAHSRGELVMPYPDLPRMHAVVVMPRVGSSTLAAFRAWDAQITQLTTLAANDRLSELSRVYASAFTPAGHTVFGGPLGAKEDQTGASGVSGSNAQDLAGNPLLALVRTGIENDFESVVFQQHPSLRAIKQALLGEMSRDSVSTAVSSALLAMLSGSGSSLFGLYRTQADAVAAQQRVSGLNAGARTFLTHTVTRDEYWGTMFPA